MIRTKMDAIKWQAAKLKPKKYGTEQFELERARNLTQENLDHQQKIEQDYKKPF